MHVASVENLAGPGRVSHAARRMSCITERDIVIAIDFPRYLADTASLATGARRDRGPVCP